MGAEAVMADETAATPPSSQAEQQQQQQGSWLIPDVPPDSSFVDGVASKDVVVNEGTGTWVRLYLPAAALDSAAVKLPILVHVHGGGFVTFSAATASFHQFCKKLAGEATVLVVSLNHRLAPQHPLPAAYEDLSDTLEWLQSQASCSTGEPWLSSHADFSCLILMGGSSGGNIVHNTLLQGKESLPPLKLQGQILLQPFFGGQDRTGSELRLSQGPVLALSKSDQLWSLALPQGASRDHPFCNPAMIPMTTLEKACLPKSLVLVGGQDLLRDKQVEFASLVKKAGVPVQLVEFSDAAHGFITSSGTVSYVFMPEVLKFIDSCRQQPEEQQQQLAE